MEVPEGMTEDSDKDEVMTNEQYEPTSDHPSN